MTPFLLLLLGWSEVVMVMTSLTCNTRDQYAVSQTMKDIVVSNGALANLTLPSRRDCSQACSQYPDCRALCWAPGHTFNCYLHCAVMTSANETLQTWPGATYLFLMEGSKPAESACPGKTCEQHYESGFRTSGVYRISLNDSEPEFDAFCDMETDGGGWTVFLNRASADVDFNRTWSECEDGFGNMLGNHWLGLTYIHRLTKAGFTMLHVDVMDWNGDRRSGKYASFTVANASDSYRLRLSDYVGDSDLNGTMGLDYNNNGVFATWDRDYRSCASSYLGPWWYRTCTYVQPMSVYIEGSACPSRHKCMIWHQWLGGSTAMKAVRFMLK